MFVSEGARGWVPGLLVGWESRPDGWWGRVVVVRDGEAVELLVAARLLKPAHTSEEPTPARGTGGSGAGQDGVGPITPGAAE